MKGECECRNVPTLYRCPGRASRYCSAAIRSRGPPGLPFTVSATVINDCTITSTNINFDTAGVLIGTLTATATLSVACPNSGAYSIALSPGAGSGATVVDRRMTRSGGTDQVHYQLYQNASYATPWGDGTNGTSVATGIGTGTTQTLTVYARVPPQTTPAAGIYTDTVIAMIAC
jgi:spore coat protein U-like protein